MNWDEASDFEFYKLMVVGDGRVFACYVRGIEEIRKLVGKNCKIKLLESEK